MNFVPWTNQRICQRLKFYSHSTNYLQNILSTLIRIALFERHQHNQKKVTNINNYLMFSPMTVARTIFFNVPRITTHAFTDDFYRIICDCLGTLYLHLCRVEAGPMLIVRVDTYILYYMDIL